MKKNLLSIIILALLIVNIVLTAIMMFSVVGAANKTSALASDILAVLDLELNPQGAGGSYVAAAVPIEDVATYSIEEAMTIRLKKSEDGTVHYCVVQPVFSMNTKHDDYKTYGDLAAKNDLIVSTVIDTVGTYTMEEISEDQSILKNAILSNIQALYGSDFIYEVSFKDIKFQ